jgi:long-subunit fatty acid transport protein
MKKVVSIALLALLGFGGLSAQERTKGEVEITPFIGYQESFFNGDNVSELDYRGAIKFGANVDYFFNDRWSLRSGLIYDSMGGKGFG